jgi:hypothetical protein
MILGLVGAKESGKTTTLGFIKDCIEVEEIQLARKLKDVCACVLGINRKDMDDTVLKETDFEKPIRLDANAVYYIMNAYNFPPDWRHLGKILTSPRKVLQYVGTEMLRSVDPEVHLYWATRDLEGDKVYVVSDIRFPNEFKFFKEMGNFKSIYIQNDEAEMRALEDSHMSEGYLLDLKSKCEFKIDNNHTKEHTAMLTKALIEHLTI